MIFIGLSGLCLGAILALKLKVLILVPATIIGTAAVAAVELVSGHGLVDALSCAAGAACVLQFGYLLGSSVKGFATEPRAVRTPKSSLSERPACRTSSTHVLFLSKKLSRRLFFNRV